MIECVEQIRAKEEPEALFDTERPAQREIGLREIEASESVASERSLHGGGGHDEGREIEFPASGYVRIIQPFRYARDQIRPKGIASETDIAR